MRLLENPKCDWGFVVIDYLRLEGIGPKAPLSRRHCHVQLIHDPAYEEPEKDNTDELAREYLKELGLTGKLLIEAMDAIHHDKLFKLKRILSEAKIDYTKSRSLIKCLKSLH